MTALELHLEPATRGDPERPLRWTSLSARRLADALSAEGHPDRDAQFRRIDRRVRAFQKLGQPVISVDTK